MAEIAANKRLHLRSRFGALEVVDPPRDRGEPKRYPIELYTQPADGIMGADGINTFDEDHAADWLADLCDQEDPKEFLRECLDLDDIEYLEMMECAGVIGTCVMIDAILNGPTKDLPDEAIEWISEHKKLAVKRLLPKAIAGIDVIIGNDSELHELWKENKKLYPKWRKLIVALKTRLVTAKG